MRNVWIVFRRELGGYFSTPIAYVFIVIFLALLGALTFTIGGLYDRGQADLSAFFGFHPWLYLLLIPAVTMRLWAEERKSGTVELLLTLPVSMAQAVLGKYLAAWCFTAITLGLTFPVWLTVGYLGRPDHGVILTGYLGSLLVAGTFLAIGGCFSALTKNQVIAYVVSAAVCFLFAVSGSAVLLEFISDWVPSTVISVMTSFSVVDRYNSLSRGVVDLRDIVFFASLIVFWLFANTVAVDLRKAS